MPTAFQKEVWSALTKIPEGKVTTYGLIAKYLNTKAVRAVGTAVGKNPYAPDIPCHRVVRADGKIGNYSGAGGVPQKVRLLNHEGIVVREGKIVDFRQHLFDFRSIEKIK